MGGAEGPPSSVGFCAEQIRFLETGAFFILRMTLLRFSALALGLMADLISNRSRNKSRLMAVSMPGEWRMAILWQKPWIATIEPICTKHPPCSSA
jgi:hypothetical protein